MSVTTSRFARDVHNEPRFRGRKKGKERETRANALSLVRPAEERTDVGAVLKISEGRPFSGTGETLWDAIKGTQRNAPVRPLYYLSRCYPMNAQCIIWIADKGHDFSRVPENFCIFDLVRYRYCPDKEISYQSLSFTHMRSKCVSFASIDK